MEIEGIVNKILAPVKGTSARGEWTKQEIIIDQPGEFSRKVCVSFWGDKAADAASLKEGEQVTASVNVESREYNGRWYTEVRAWRLQKKSAEQQPSQPMSEMPPLDGGNYTSEPADDLPF